MNVNAGSSSSSAALQPRPRPLIRGAVGSGSTVLVNNCQRGNPVLQHIRNVGWEYADIVPDFQVGLSSCALFLSIRYHRLHPEYVHTRIQKLQQMYTLRILLIICDVNDHQATIKELTKVCIINNLTLIVTWSAEEAARYLETYKSFEHKPPDLIKERISQDYLSQLTAVLTSVRGINKTDVVTLISNFGSLESISKATVEQLGMCPGFGEIKARRLRDVFHQPFRVGETRSWKERIQQQQPSIQFSSEQQQQQQPSQFSSESSTAVLDTNIIDLEPIHLVGDQDLLHSSTSSSTETNNDIEPIQDDVDVMTEDEQLQLALAMSMQDT